MWDTGIKPALKSQCRCKTLGFSSPLPKLTRHTITNPKKVLSEYKKVRSGGFSTCISEDVEGIGALACPISLPEIGVIYSVGITGPLETVIGEPTANLKKEGPA